MGSAIRDYSSIAFVLPCSTATGYVIGYLLDKAFHTHFLYLVFLLLGTIGGLIEVIRQAQKMISRNDQ
jgi:F0F1-type ATP synthase assembly protein I